MNQDFEPVASGLRCGILKWDADDGEGEQKYYWIEVTQDSWIEVEELPKTQEQLDLWAKSFNVEQGENGIYRILTATRWLKLKGMEIFSPPLTS
jgi:hypothetical protein